jgi:hypothetical protein
VCFVGVTLFVSIMFGAGQIVFMRILHFQVLELFKFIIKPVVIGKLQILWISLLCTILLQFLITFFLYSLNLEVYNC